MDTQLVRRNEHMRERWLPDLPAAEPVAELSMLPDLRKLLQIMWHRRCVILVVFLVVFLGVVAGTVLQDPVYRATGVLEIRRDSADAVAPETLFNLLPVSDEYLRTECGILTSTTLAERVIKELNLADADEFKPALWRKWLGLVTPPKMAGLAEKFESLLIVAPVPGSWLVQVSFDALDPDRSARVVNSVLSNYVRLRVEGGDKASTWLSAQLQATQTKLMDSEEQLRKYTQSNGLQLLESDKGDTDNLINNRLRQLQEALTQAEGARYIKESEAAGVRNAQGRALDSLENPVIESLSVRLAEQKREYARLMSSFLPEYPKAKEVRNQIDELEAQLQSERERHGDKITIEYQAAVKREQLLRQALEDQQKLVYRVSAKTSGYNTLKREVETNKQLYTVLQQKLKEVGVSTALKATNVGIVDQANAPTKPDQPKPVLNLALGGMLGLMLGVGIAFLRDHLDTKLKTADEVGTALGLPALGLIPSVMSIGRQTAESTTGSLLRSSPNWYRIDRDVQQSSVLANAFAALRTSVLFRGSQAAPRSLLVTSSRPGEGKTTVSVNLALSLAKLGRRVLLIDGDARRPCVHRVFGLPNHEGLTTYLSGDEYWGKYVRNLQTEGMSVLTSGPTSIDSTELLSSSRLKRLMAEATESYDFVVVDSPALFINLADARILSEAVDGSVFVVRSGATPREVALRALEQAHNVIGVVVNDLRINILPGYYREYYGPDKARPGSYASARAGRPAPAQQV